MHSQFQPLLCITPPHILKAIAERGTPAQQAQAVKTLQVTARLQEQRVDIAKGRATARTVEAPAKSRNIYDAGGGSGLPGQLVRKEGDPPTGDGAVNEAYEGAGSTYDLFWDVFARNSIDNQGLRLDSTVHYGIGYDNAFWNGEQMVYGDGDEDLPPDQRLFNRFTAALDIIAHELVHGVTMYEANLNYSYQPGALNESLSDVFATLVKQYALRQTAAEADWIIGQGLFTSNVNGLGVRSLKAPGTAYNDTVLGKDPQPAHMSEYVSTLDDNGGVHINSGIPNHAFYVTAVQIGGYAWEKAGRIWYVALRDQLTATGGFQDAARITTGIAGDLFGSGSLEQQAVRAGWSEVGIQAEVVGNENSGCLPALWNLFWPPRR